MNRNAGVDTNRGNPLRPTMTKASSVLFLLPSLLILSFVCVKPLVSASKTSSSSSPSANPSSLYVSLQISGSPGSPSSSSCSAKVLMTKQLKRRPGHIHWAPVVADSVDGVTEDKQLREQFIAVVSPVATSPELSFSFSDPRDSVHPIELQGEKVDGEDYGEHLKKEHRPEEGTQELWLPRDDVTSLVIYCPLEIGQEADRGNMTGREGRSAPKRGTSNPSGEDRTMRRKKLTLSLVDFDKSHRYYEQATTEVSVLHSAVVGPVESQVNIIVVSSGYVKSEKEMFQQHAERFALGMQDPMMVNPNEIELNKSSVPEQTDLEKYLGTNFPPDSSSDSRNLHRSSPFSRYWPFFNVYSVYEESEESGASRPQYKKTVKSNLQCEHKKNMERLIICSQTLAKKLADRSPGNVYEDPGRNWIIVLVNTETYGGAGSSAGSNSSSYVAAFYSYPLRSTGSSYLQNFLAGMIHEMGHSFGNLADEYSYGTTKTNSRRWNCQEATTGPTLGTSQWDHWLEIAHGSSAEKNWRTTWGNNMSSSATAGSATPWTVLSTAKSPCSYTNYYKPSSHCIMQSLTHPFFCPVCREQATLTMFRRSAFKLTWPRIPLEDTITIIPKDVSGVSADDSGDTSTLLDTTVNFHTSLTLHLSSILTERNSFKVTFTDTFDGSDIPIINSTECPACAVLTPSHFAKYPLDTIIRINATVEDLTSFVTPRYRNLVSGTATASSSEKELYEPHLKQTTAFQIIIVQSIGASGGTQQPNLASRSSSADNTTSNTTLGAIVDPMENITLITFGNNVTAFKVGTHGGLMKERHRWTLCPEFAQDGVSVPVCHLDNHNESVEVSTLLSSSGDSKSNSNMFGLLGVSVGVGVVILVVIFCLIAVLMAPSGGGGKRSAKVAPVAADGGGHTSADAYAVAMPQPTRKGSSAWA